LGNRSGVQFQQEKKRAMAVGTVTGIIKDSTTAQPIAGVVVTTSGGARSDPSDSQGQYSFTDEAGTYTLWGDKSGYHRYTGSVTVVASTTRNKNFSMIPM
jgi:hypothetical protein